MAGNATLLRPCLLASAREFLHRCMTLYRGCCSFCKSPEHEHSPLGCETQPAPVGIRQQPGSFVRAVHAVDWAHGVDDIPSWEIEPPAPAHGEACCAHPKARVSFRTGKTYGVMCACPVGQRVLGGSTIGSCLQASTSSGPAALCMAPSTPPPPSSGGAAAFTIASTCYE